MMEMEVLRDGKLVVSLVVHYATQSKPNKWCNQTVGQVALPLREEMASKTKESGRSALLIGHLSIPVLTRLVLQPRMISQPHGVRSCCVADSAVNVVYCCVSSHNMLSSKRCWFLHGAHLHFSQSVFRALCQQRLWLPESTNGYVCFGLPFRKRFMLFSVNVPVHLKLARRCNNFGHVCSFSGKAHRQLGSVFQDRLLHLTHRVQYARFIARALVHSFHANHGQGHTWGGRGLQCAKSSLIFAIISGAHCRTFRAHSTSCLAIARIITRSQSTGNFSNSLWHAEPRPKPAT